MGQREHFWQRPIGMRQRGSVRKSLPQKSSQVTNHPPIPNRGYGELPALHFLSASTPHAPIEEGWLIRDELLNRESQKNKKVLKILSDYICNCLRAHYRRLHYKCFYPFYTQPHLTTQFFSTINTLVQKVSTILNLNEHRKLNPGPVVLQGDLNAPTGLLRPQNQHHGS